MKNTKYRLVDLYSNTRFCISNLALLDLFERSSEGKTGLEISLFQILTHPEKAKLFEHSLRIDASILTQDDELGVYKHEDVQDEITAFIEDLRLLIEKHKGLLTQGKPLYIGIEEPNTLILGLVLKEKLCATS